MAADKGDAAATNDFVKAVDRMRETTKWLLAISAGVGATLVAGLQLTSIGDFEEISTRSLAAMGGYVFALLGVGLAIVNALAVFTVKGIGLREGPPKVKSAHEESIRDMGILLGRETINSVDDEYRKSLRQDEALRTQLEDMEAELERATRSGNAAAGQSLAQERERLVEKIDRLHAEIEFLGARVRQIVSARRFLQVQSTFRNSSIWMIISAGLVALAVPFFAWGTNPPESNPPRPGFLLPALGSVTLTEERVRAISSRVGENCLRAAQSHDVIVLGQSGESYEILILPDENCALTRLTGNTDEVFARTPIGLQSVGDTETEGRP